MIRFPESNANKKASHSADTTIAYGGRTSRLRAAANVGSFVRQRPTHNPIYETRRQGRPLGGITRHLPNGVETIAVSTYGTQCALPSNSCPVSSSHDHPCHPAAQHRAEGNHPPFSEGGDGITTIGRPQKSTHTVSGRRRNNTTCWITVTSLSLLLLGLRYMRTY